METYPIWFQLALVFVIADVIPTAVVFTLLRFKRFPAMVKNIMFVVGVIAIDRLNNVIPVSEQAKTISDYLFGACIVVFLVWAIKNKWLWDESD